ncbi:hypothetical protein TNCV_4257441 [Trichonephila clavipes]|nr:hypothetical protein TNCV_4257441 [Trichonephila clavipes]
MEGVTLLQVSIIRKVDPARLYGELHKPNLLGTTGKILAEGENDCDVERDRRERRDSGFTGEKPRFSVNVEVSRDN